LRNSCTFISFKEIFSNLLKSFFRARVQQSDEGKKGKMNKSIICTYPDFRSLPKGLKQMLVISENLFFEEAQTAWLKTEDHGDGNKNLWRPAQKQFHAYDRVAA
jgi:hypothetical protein